MSFVKKLKSFFSRKESVSKVQLQEPQTKMETTQKKDPVEKSEEMKKPTSLGQVSVPPPFANQPEIVPTTDLDISKLPTPGEKKPQDLPKVLPLIITKQPRFFNWKKALFWVGATAAFSSLLLGVVLGMVVNGNCIILVFLVAIIIKSLSPFTTDEKLKDSISRPWYY